MNEGWRYYNHAAVPMCAPHENPDLTSIKDGSIYKWRVSGGRYQQDGLRTGIAGIKPIGGM